jgi:hypothetical protein
MTTGTAGRTVICMKHLLTAAVAAATALAILTAPAGAHSSGTTMKLVLKDAGFHLVDAAPKDKGQNPTVGDQFVIGNIAMKGGKAIGRADLVCTVTKVGAKGASECIGTLTLPNGSISVSGASQFATNGDTFAVTGGTGAYAGARGTISTVQGKKNTENLTATLL